MCVGILGFYTTYIGEVAYLKTSAKVVLDKFQERGNPLYYEKGASGVPLQGSTAEQNLDALARRERL
jgi:hypothetical protein